MTNEMIGTAVRAIHALNHLHRLSIHRLAAQYEIHFGQMPILRYILEHDGCTQREIANHMSVSPPSIAMSIKRMQRAGLVEKHADESDMRRSRLTVTEMGRENEEKCRREFDLLYVRMFDGFGDEEAAAVIGYLDRMADNIKRSDPELEALFEKEACCHKHKGKGRHGC